MSRSNPSQRRSVFLRLDCLEDRETPAGNITAALTGGVLTLTGDNADNAVTIKLNSGSVDLTPDATTSINGGTPGAPVTLMGTATSLKAALSSGNDALFIDNTVNFAMPGGVTIDGGHGNNIIVFVTGQQLTLGNFTYKGGDGNDLVQIGGGAGMGSTLTGKATLDVGVGPSLVTFDEIALGAPGSISLKTSGTGNNDQITLTNVTAPGGVKVNSKNANTTISLNGSTIGSLNLANSMVGQVFLVGGAINGNVSLKCKNQALVSMGASNITGNLSASAEQFAALQTQGTVAIGGNVGLKALNGQLFVGFTAGDSLAVGKNVSIQGSNSFVLVTLANLTAGNLTLKGANAAVANFFGLSVITLKQLSMSASHPGANVNVFSNNDKLTINGNCYFTAKKGTVNTNFLGNDLVVQGSMQIAAGTQAIIGIDTNTSGQINQKLTVSGGVGNDQIQIESPITINGDVILDLKEGNNQVILGDTTGAVQLTKNVKVKTGAGDDLFEMYRVLVTGTCTINTGAGGDAIRFEYGSTFTGFVMVDSGAGDDLLQAGFQTGAPSTTNFNGGLIAKLGDGNDELLLGLDPGAGGDANSLANFGAASIIDGGTGLNLFDGLTLLWVPYQPPSAYAGPLTLLNWTDPLP